MRKGWERLPDGKACRDVWPWEMFVFAGENPGTFAYRVENIRNAEPLYEQSELSQELSLPTEEQAMLDAEEQLRRVLSDALWTLDHAPRDGERPHPRG